MVSIAAGRRIAVIIILIVAASSSVLSKTTKNATVTATQIEDMAPIIPTSRNVSIFYNDYIGQEESSTTRKPSDFHLVAQTVVLSLAVITPAAITVAIVVIATTRKRKANEMMFFSEDPDPDPSTTEQRPLTTRFLNRLRRIIELYPKIVTWSPDGSYFHILDVKAFETHVLPNKELGIRSKKYENWARNLVNFRFRRYQRRWRHANGFFVRDDKELQSRIRKREAKKKNRPAAKKTVHPFRSAAPSQSTASRAAFLAATNAPQDTTASRAAFLAATNAPHDTTASRAAFLAATNAPQDATASSPPALPMPLFEVSPHSLNRSHSVSLERAVSFMADALGSSFELPHSPAIPSGPVATPRPSAGRVLSSSSLDASVFAPHDVMTPRSSAGSAFSLGLLGSTIVEMPDDISSISRQISVLSTDSALSTSYLDETIQNIPSSGSALSD